MVTKAHASLSPSVEVSLHVNRAAGALVAADGPVLVEGLGAVDGRLVVAGGHVDIVGVTISVDGSLLLSTASGVVRAVVLDDLRVLSVSHSAFDVWYNLRSTRREGYESNRRRQGSRCPGG